MVTNKPKQSLGYSLLISGTLKRNNEDVIDVAVKRPKSFTEDINRIIVFYEEIKIAVKFNHDNVVKCFGFYEDPRHNYPHLVFEYMFYGSLDRIIDRLKFFKQFTQSNYKEWFDKERIGIKEFHFL